MLYQFMYVCVQFSNSFVLFTKLDQRSQSKTNLIVVYLGVKTKGVRVVPVHTYITYRARAALRPLGALDWRRAGKTLLYAKCRPQRWFLPIDSGNDRKNLLISHPWKVV